MPVVPDDRIQAIEFCETHVPVWTSAPAAAIGLTAGQVTALSGLTTTARARYQAALAARQASKAATESYYAGVSDMRTQVADMVRAIKAFAEQQAKPSAIYTAAQIPEPLPPSPVPAPGKPTDFIVTLQPSGAVTLSWSAVGASASSGAFFTVARKLPGQNAFVSIGGAPGSTVEQRRPSFTDANVPASAASAGVQYIVQAQRGADVGLPSDAVTVQFGIDGGGGAIVTGGTLKMAA